MTIANVFGSTILIAIFFPYFLIAIVIILFGYAYFQQYYRRSAREIKRIDSMLRSLLYGHFSESLNGLSTIRAYAVTKDYVKHNSYYMDLESRALYLICTNQRWLAIRLVSTCPPGHGGLSLMSVVLLYDRTRSEPSCPSSSASCV
jgi:ATP-binding cassette subfamily C (CFTR/MRP) protein 1